MCGRTFYNIDLDVLKKKFNCKKIIENKKLKKGIINKNNYSPIIFQEKSKTGEHNERDNVLCVCSWGINPAPFKNMDDKIVLINARFETLTSKKTFSSLLSQNRCAIAVNGFFEWKNMGKSDFKNSKEKVPYFIFCKQGFSLLDEEDVQSDHKDVKKKKEEVKEEIKQEKKELKAEVEAKDNTAGLVMKMETKEGENNLDDGDDGEPLTKLQENTTEENNVHSKSKKRKFEETDDVKRKKEKADETQEENKETEKIEEEKDTGVKQETIKHEKLIKHEEEEVEKQEEDTEKEINNKKTKNENVEALENHTDQFKTCMLLAGLYTVDEKEVYKYTVITTASENEFLQDIHERCPVFLSEKSLSLWLNLENKYADIKDKIAAEHNFVCNNLSKVSVTSWSTYVVSSKNKVKK